MKPIQSTRAKPEPIIPVPDRSSNRPCRRISLSAIDVDRLKDEFAGAFPRLPKESVPVFESLGRVLREHVRTKTPLPPYSRSVVDGYAVRTTDIESATPSGPVFLKLKDCLAAGDDCRCLLNEGEAIRLTSGTRIPAGADRAIPDEFTTRQDNTVRIDRMRHQNRLIIEKGEDAPANKVLLERGIRIGPVAMGALAACGRESVMVSCRPSLGILSTGNEIRPPGPARPGRYTAFDVNGPLLAGLARQAGAETSYIGLCQDSTDSFCRLFKAAGQLDIVVITGGTANGDFDLMEKNMLSTGSHIKFRLRTGSGRRVFVAQKHRQILVGLPGNPLAALTNFIAVVRPLLYALMGRTGKLMSTGMARNVENRLLKPGHDHLLPAKLESRHGQAWVRLLAGSASSRLGTLMNVDALVHVKNGARQLKRGELVTVFSINPVPEFQSNIL